MLEIESIPPNQQMNRCDVEGYNQETILSHIDLLVDAGMVNGKVIKTMKGFSGCLLKDLTWEGHDFLSAARDNKLWAKAKEAILNGTVSFSFALLKKWLEKHSPIG